MVSFMKRQPRLPGRSGGTLQGHRARWGQEAHKELQVSMEMEGQPISMLPILILLTEALISTMLVAYT